MPVSADLWVGRDRRSRILDASVVLAASGVIHPRGTLASMGDDDLVIHSSLRGWLAAIFSPAALLLLGAAGVIGVGLRPIPTTLLLLGSGLAGVVLLDLPRYSVFSRRGITRVCPLRRHFLPWHDIVAIERTRPHTTTMLRNAVDRGIGEPQISGGLTARGRGRRKWLLADNLESREEHRSLRAVLDDLEVPVMLRAPAPHADAPPTYLYRRRSRGRG